MIETWYNEPCTINGSAINVVPVDVWVIVKPLTPKTCN